MYIDRVEWYGSHVTELTITLIVLASVMTYIVGAGFTFGLVKRWEEENCTDRGKLRNTIFYDSPHQYHNHATLATFLAISFPLGPVAYLAARRGETRAMLKHPGARERRINQLEAENDKLLRRIETR